MNNKLQSFAKVLLKEQYEDFQELLHLFENEDRKTFVLQHRKMLEKGWYDIESYNDLSEVDLLICFAISFHKMAIIDWSGEEYPGQVKRNITMMLKNYGIERFMWDTKKFEKSLNWDTIRRGDYLPLLFLAMNKQLNKDSFSIAFLDTQSDSFLYTVLPTTDFVRIENAELESNVVVISPKIYNIFLTDKGNELSKIMLYLKRKFAVPLNEIKEFCSKEKILLGIGNSIIVKKYRDEIEELGGKIEVEELDR